MAFLASFKAKFFFAFLSGIKRFQSCRARKKAFHSGINRIRLRVNQAQADQSLSLLMDSAISHPDHGCDLFSIQSRLREHKIKNPHPIIVGMGVWFENMVSNTHSKSPASWQSFLR